MFAESFLENKGIAGGRKRNLEDSDEAEEDEDFGDDDDYIGMSNNSKQQAAGAPTTGRSAGSPTPRRQQAAGGAADADIEFITNRMSKMAVVSDKGARGYNFNCVHPHFWWTYSVLGVKYMKIEFLVWTCHEDDVGPKISKCGKYLYFSNKILEHFLSLDHLFKCYGNDLPGDPNNCGEAMYEEGLSHVKSIHEDHEMEDIKPVIKIELPFTAQQEFEDPYQPNQKGYSLRSYPHEKDKERKMYIYHVNLKDASAPRSKTKTEYAHIDMDDKDDL